MTFLEDYLGEYYVAIIIGALLLLFALMLLIRRIRRRSASLLIVPTILHIPELVKKNSLRVKLAIPQKNHPVKFTIYSEGGRPLQQVILKGSRRRARIRVNELENGTYKCDLSNAGAVSESKIFRISRKK